MERATVVRLAGAALVLLFLVAGSWLLFWSHIDRPIDIPEQDFHRFPGVAGLSHVTVVPPRVPASWTTYGQGSKSRMAILLTDPNSSWLGLAHG